MFFFRKLRWFHREPKVVPPVRDVILTFRVDPEGYVAAELFVPPPSESESEAVLAHRVASGLRLLNDGRFLPTLEAAVGRCLDPKMASNVLARMDAMASHIRETGFPGVGGEVPCVSPSDVFGRRFENHHGD